MGRALKAHEQYEVDIEKKVCDHAKNTYDALTIKFTSPQRRSVPDRLFIMPNGVLFFIEFKRLGKVATDNQKREHKKLTDRGQTVYVIDNVEFGVLLVDSWARKAGIAARA